MYMVSFCLFVLDLATTRVLSTCYTALHRLHLACMWEFCDSCFVLDRSEAEERKKECSCELPDSPAFFCERIAPARIFFLFLATKSQVGGRQREKLVANGELATGNFEQLHKKVISQTQSSLLCAKPAQCIMSTLSMSGVLSKANSIMDSCADVGVSKVTQ